MNEIQNKLYQKIKTFMGTPSSRDTTNATAAILGCPFDCGTHPFRVGSRQGPQAIRDQSYLIRPFQSELADENILEKLSVVDAGDVNVVSSRTDESFDIIEEAAYQISVTGAIPIGFGGDGSVSLPLIRAASRIHNGLAVLHFDSHTDAYEVDPVHKYDAATQFSHVALEQRISVSSSYHIGLRGSTSSQNVYQHGKNLGYNLITINDFLDRGHDNIMSELHTKLKGRPIYLSWDMDVFDPSCAPGVCTPEWGGFSAREGINIIRDLTGLNIVGADINTVSPPHDLNGMTAFLAASITYEILLNLWRSKTMHK